MTHCLETGGDHVRAQHFRLLMDCAVICAMAADFMLHKSQFHHALCGLCADVCKTCADDCAALADMDDCARACQACAEQCGAMAKPA
jgi:hypothetical protein